MKSIFLFLITLLIVGCIVFFIACKNAANKETKVVENSSAPVAKMVSTNVPDWHKNATIYEVNLRHFTEEGTFKAFESHVPRLKELGIDILWFMPIHEISLKNRKGELGSPYAVKDYKGVNPDMGTMDDFKHLLQTIHEAGMYCIIDWVPNHTGWDNWWIKKHKDWYTQDSLGNVIDPIDPNTGKSWGWTDVADLNFDNPDMRAGMIDAMAFWIRDIGIDGFRVDVAHNVPVDFWVECADSLYAIKPIFMLAEAEVPAIRNNGAFIADYGWEFHHLMNEIAKSQGATIEKTAKLVQGNLAESEEEEEKSKNALDIDEYLSRKSKDYSKGYHMHFTSNHDENSWSGTEFKRMGDGHLTFAVLAATFDGMPLIYTGQESAMDKQLDFFGKDEVPWASYSYTDFYKTLFDLKHRNQALWNGEHGGNLVKIPTGKDEYVYAFLREKNGDKVVVILNLSSEDQEIKLEGNEYIGDYNNVFAQGTTSLTEDMMMHLKAWDYVVLSNK